MELIFRTLLVLYQKAPGVTATIIYFCNAVVYWNFFYYNRIIRGQKDFAIFIHGKSTGQGRPVEII